jgi:HlyD family secretion protein
MPTETAPATATPPQAPKKRGGPPKPLIFLVLLAAIAFGVWKLFLQKTELPGSVIALSGRIEGDDSAVSPKITGRILEIHYREGDTVKAGDVIAVLDDQQMHDRERQAQDAVATAEARLRSAQQAIAVFRDQLTQTELQTGQSKVDADGRVRQAEAELSAAEADLAQQQATLQLLTFDRDAYTKLAKTGAVSDRQAREAVSKAEAQEAAVKAAQRRVEAARSSVNVAKANLTNPEIRTAQSAAIRSQMAQQQSEIASAASDAQRARASLAEAQANQSDLIVRAPYDGTIATRTAEPGEVVQAGTAIVTMLDLSKVYLRGFIPEGQIGNVKIGQPAHVFLDSSPNQPVDAVVTRIDPSATFTPENTYFRDDRVKQVVGVKLQLKGAIGFAKPGMPADGQILVSGDTWPPESLKPVKK